MSLTDWMIQGGEEAMRKRVGKKGRAGNGTERKEREGKGKGKEG